jgi:DNA polymerase-3 subunit beta
VGIAGLPLAPPVLNSDSIMKFKVNRNHFFNGLSSVTNVVGNRATMPILQNVLIEAEGDMITLTTTNLDLGICCRIKASVSSPGRITLPVKKLVPIIRALSSADTIVELTGKDRVKITSGSSVFQLAGLPADQFPPISNFAGQPTITIDQDNLGSMLRKVSYAQSTDENRYILNGVFFEFSAGKLTLVATDGRRLAKCEQKLEGSDKTLALILPARTITELSRLLKSGGKVHVSNNERQVGFTIDIPTNDEGLVDRIQLVSKVVEGNYPNYRQVIPKDVGSKVRLEREKLLESVQRAALMTDDRSNTIRMTVSKKTQNLEISAKSDSGEAHEPIAVKYDGPEVNIAFNPQYVIEPLRNVTEDEIDFEFKDDMSPGVIRGLKEDFLCVVMPQRIS